MYIKGKTNFIKNINVYSDFNPFISGNGIGIYNINASNISLGKISSERLPKATTLELGCVKIDNNTILIDSNGVISGSSQYGDNNVTSLLNNGINSNIETSGNIIGDGSQLTNLNANYISTGIISSERLPKASISELGGVKADGTTILIDSNGVISGSSQYGDNNVTSLLNNGINSNINTSGNIIGNGSQLTNLNANNIISGTISNNILPNDITISGTLTASNLNINGEITIINTNNNTNSLNTLGNYIYIDNSTSKDINYIATYKNSTKYIDVLNYNYTNVTVSDNIITNNEEITNNLYSGDIIKLIDYNENIKYEFVKTYYDNKLTIFDTNKVDTGIVEITNIKYIKQNYRLLFSVIEDTDLDCKFIDDNDYTKININSNKIYNFNINVNFDLTIGTDNCRLYIKLERENIEPEYVRIFTLSPISKNNVTTTLNASFTLFLRTGDIITLESNYKLNSGNIDINTNKIVKDDNNILFIGTYEKTVSYVKNIEYNDNDIIINNNIANYINIDNNNKLSNGDLINIYNEAEPYIENIKRVYETSYTCFTIYDYNNISRGTIIESNNKFSKYNNRLLFNNTSLVDINYSELNIINNNYTTINIKSNKKYLFNISCVFDLLFGTDYCKLYVKLERLNQNPIYIRKFESPPITSQTSNKTATMSNAFILNLIEGDKITFESNYEIFEGFLDIQTKEFNNTIDNIFFIGLYENNINYIKDLDNNNNDIIIKDNIAYYDNIDSINKIIKGDIINLYTNIEDNIEIKTINNATDNYFTIYNKDYSDNGKINSQITKYSKYNYRLLFNNTSVYEVNNSKFNVINNSYTSINITENNVYSFNIGCIFDLIYGTDFCKLYIRLDRKNEESKYIRTFNIYPIKSIKNGNTGTLTASFKLNLNYGDTISFETNYKLLNGFLDINTEELLEYEKINNTTPWITNESVQNLPWYANNTSFIGTYSYIFNFIENNNFTYKSISNRDDNKFYVNNLNNFDISNKLYKGDILKLKYNGNTYYRRIKEINYTNNYFTLYNKINEATVNINNYTEFRKANYLIMFNDNNDNDNKSDNVINTNNYTEVKIPSDRIYNFNINVNFDLTYATNYCRLYIKLQNSTNTKYIRIFYLEPISMFDNISSSLNASFKLKLNKNDIITFESNHKLNEGYLDIDL